MSATLFGALSSGERLASIECSPNYADGVFHNQINGHIRMTDQPELSVRIRAVFGGKGSLDHEVPSL